MQTVKWMVLAPGFICGELLKLPEQGEVIRNVIMF